jgi:hypothetical protein
MTNARTQIIYRLDGINAEDGVDVFEIAPVLMHFGELIRSANAVVGFDSKLDIKVKPFREGSWITDFIIQESQVGRLLDFLNSKKGRDLMLLMAFLGFSVKDGVVGLANIIRFTHGHVANFVRTADKETITYMSPSGEKLEVTLPEHRLVQSPLIQNNYYNCTVVPFDKFPSTTAVSFKMNDVTGNEQTISRDDKKFIERYAKTELLEDAEDNVSMLNGIYLKPKRGSYSGEEKAYSFVMGENNTLYPVTIDDEQFLQKLRSGELRLYSEDVLRVNLKISQRKDATNKVLATYSVVKVEEYIKFEKPQQLGLDGLSK